VRDDIVGFQFIGERGTRSVSRGGAREFPCVVEVGLLWVVEVFLLCSCEVMGGAIEILD